MTHFSELLIWKDQLDQRVQIPTSHLWVTDFSPTRVLRSPELINKQNVELKSSQRHASAHRLDETYVIIIKA